MRIFTLISAIIFFHTILCITAEEVEKFSRLLTQGEQSNKNLTVLEDWQYLEQKVKEIAKYGTKKLLPILLDNSAKMNLSKECMKNSMHLLSGLKDIKGWAFRFLDSSAKGIDGFLDGSLQSFGVYDECVNTDVRSTKLRDNGKLLFRGQYCTIDIKLPLPPRPRYLNIYSVVDELRNLSKPDTVFAEIAKMAHYLHFFTSRLGICTPSGCSTEDMNKVSATISTAISPVKLLVSRCEVKETNHFTPTVIAVISCYSFAAFLMLIGTSIDIHSHYRKINFKNKVIRTFMAFSLLTNFKKFTSTKMSSETFRCLNGVRFLSVTWVIVVHTYTTLNFQLINNTMDIKAVVQDFALQPILNASTVVDTFFFIGGLLVCYLVIKDVRQQGRKLNVTLYIVHRLWRILPVYIYVIIFAFLLNLFGSGPVWYDTVQKGIQNCYDNWWTNLLFINNLHDAENMCHFHSWYLAADFQLYVGALLILLPMIKWPKIGILLSVLTIIASMIYSGIKTYVNDFPPTMIVSQINQEFMIHYWAKYYFKTFIHAGPYCIGILAGYLLATKPNLKIPPVIQVLGWFLAFITNFSIVYCTVVWNRGPVASVWSSVFYASFSKTAWSIGIAWMVICCATGHGGIINHILSWKIFVPLGRLTFVAYLVHPIVQLIIIGNIKHQIQLVHFFIVWLNFGHLCVTYGIAFAGSMLIEAPFMSLEKIFLEREKKLKENCVNEKNNPKENELRKV